jgi:type III secretion protein J
MVPAQAAPVLPESEGMVSVSTLMRGAIGVVALIVLAIAGRGLWRMRKPRTSLPDTVQR